MIVQLVLVIIIFAILIYLQHMWKLYTYWKKRGVVGPTPYPVIGNYKSVLFGTETEADFLRKLYEQYPNEKFVGLYKGIRPVLLIRDPDYIRCVLIRDFDHHSDRCIEKIFQVYKKSLFTMRGDEWWQTMRLSLSPNFTKVKIEKNIPLIKNAADKYLKFVDYLVKNNIDQEIAHLNTRYTVQLIGNLFLCLDLSIFDDTNEFQKVMRAMLDQILNASPMHTYSYMFPLIVDMLTPKIHRDFNKRVYNGLRKFLTSLIYEPRDNKTLRHTFIDYMINLKETRKIRNGKISPQIDDEDILQQITTIILASYEAIATVMSFMIHELAVHQDIQEKCYKEARTVLEKYNGEVTSESLNELIYLDMTLDETMRLHFPSHCLERRSVSEYTFPNTNLTIDKSTFIFVSGHGLQRDPKYFPNPNAFDPERFSPENKAKIPPCVYMPFGIGPRICLGARLAKTTILICIAYFLQKYKVSPSSKTATTVKYDPSRLLAVNILGGVWVKIEPRN